MPQPQLLILDPAPTRETLVNDLRQQGYLCEVAQGLHDAMVQCIIRKPRLIVADMSVPGGSGDECRKRLEQLPQLQDTPFLMIGVTDDPSGLSADASTTDILARITAQVPVTDTEPSEAPPQIPAPPPPALMEVLAQLVEQGADASVGVTDSDNRYGEILVSGGEPIHAATEDGLTGPAAMAAISAMDVTDITLGPAPRAETPHTLNPLEPEAPTPSQDGAETDNIDDPSPAPEATTTPEPEATPNRAELLPLLEELAALGIVAKVQP